MNSTNTSAELGNSSAEFGADRNLGAHEQEQSVYETLPSHGSLGESSRLAGMDSAMLVGATVTQGSALIGAVLIVAMLPALPALVGRAAAVAVALALGAALPAAQARRRERPPRLGRRRGRRDRDG